MREVQSLFALNRGLCSPLGLARTDQKRVSLSAEISTNWIPRVLGSMSLRPGFGYIGSTQSNAAARYLPFVFATTDTALVEFTDSIMRIWINDVLLTRPTVATTITNGTFAGSLTGWTASNDSGAGTSYNSGLQLQGDGTDRAIEYQTLTIAAPDFAVEHGLHIVIAKGPVTFKVGTSLGDDSLIAETSLDTGTYSLAFTPNGATAVVQFISTAAYVVLVTQCTIESAGVVTIASPYKAADLSNIRHDQSADTVFLACAGYQQRKIERRGTRPGARGWGISTFRVTDGPFLTQNFGATTLTPSALIGDITLSASRPLFKAGHLGALFQVTNQVAGVSASLVAQNTFTTSLKVTGTGNTRSITVTLTGTWVATAHLQVSTDNSTFTDVPGEVWNGNVTGPYLDGLDGQTRYYRVGIKTGDYTSGTMAAALTYTSGALAGIAIITAVLSSTSAFAQVVSDMGGTTATAVWAEGTWSTVRGYPTCIRLHEGRLWWAGQNGLIGSISDSYFSYDPNVIGDAGLIDRTIGSGPVDTINDIASLQRMILMAQGAEFSVKSSAFDTPLTPTDFTIKPASTQGSAAVGTVRIDQRALFVDRTTAKVFEVVFDLQSYEYSSNDLTQIVPELGLPGISRVAVQRKPDTRMHCVRTDGTVMLGVLDKVEDVLSWQNVTTNGTVEDVVVLPAAVGSTEDQVYYVVNRTINGSTVRYLEKWAKETECRGGTLNKQADSFITYSGTPVTQLSGLGNMEGQAVVVWADGIDIGTQSDGSQLYAVSSGALVQRGPNTLSLDGTTLGYAYTLNAPANQITGTIQIIAYVAAASYAPAGAQVIVSKFNPAGNQRSYQMFIGTDGSLNINWSADGITGFSLSSGTGFLSSVLANNQGAWVGLTFVPNNLVVSTVNFFYSLNSPTTPVASVSLTGTSAVAGALTSIFSGTADLEVGSNSAGVNGNFNGKIYSVYVCSGIVNSNVSGFPATGTLAASMVANDAVVGAKVFNSVLTSETWNLKGTAAIALGGGTTGTVAPVRNAVIGLPYIAQWQSAKLGIQPSLAQTLLNQQKRISHMGMVAAWIHPRGLRFGPFLTDADLDDLPSVERGDIIDQNVVRTAYDEQEFPFGGTWDADTRLCLQAQAPRPVTLLAAIVDLDIHD